MFFAITFLVGFLLTAFLSPKPKIENAKAASLSDFNFPRADEGDPVPRWYGTNKFKGPNTIWVGDFQAVPIKKKVKTGLFSSKKQTIGYKYYVGLDLAVALGPGFRFKRIWAGKYELWNGCPSDCYDLFRVNMPELFGGEEKNGGFVGDIALYCGDFDQPQDSYLISKIDADVPAYNGIAHMVFRKCYMGNSPNIEPIYIEGGYFSNSLNLADDKHIMADGLDANPVEVLHDLIVNEYANMNVDPTKLNTAQWRACAYRIWSENNGMSVIVGNSNQGGEVAKQILRQINGTMFQNPSTGLWELVLLRKDYTIEELPVPGPGQISDISNFTKKLWNETNNRLRLKFTDRAQDYKENAVAQADDFANIRFQKRINGTEVSMPTVFRADLANELAARELANLNVPLYQCELTSDRTQVGLLPGSVFVLNWPEYGIVQIVMRVRKMGLGTLENGRVTYGVVQDEFASDAVVISPPQTSNPPPPDASAKPIVAVEFELPHFLNIAGGFDSNVGHAAFLAAPPSQYSVEYNFVTEEAGEDVFLLDREPYTARAKLSAPIARFAGFNDEARIDNVYIEDVSNIEVLSTVSQDRGEGWPMRAGHGLIYIGGELFAYTGAYEIEDEPGKWRLGNTYRAMLDTGWQAHEAGDTVFFIEGQTGFLPEDGPTIGKLQDITRQGRMPLEDIPNTLVEITGRALLPLPPDGVRLDTFRNTAEERDAGETANLTWLERNRVTNDTFVKFEDDDTEAPEAGTTYVVTVEDDLGDTVFTSPDIAATNYDLTFTNDMAGRSTILVWAKRGGNLSLSGSPFPIKVVPTDGTLTVDGDVVRVDGEKVTVA